MGMMAWLVSAMPALWAAMTVAFAGLRNFLHSAQARNIRRHGTAIRKLVAYVMWVFGVLLVSIRSVPQALIRLVGMAMKQAAIVREGAHAIILRDCANVLQDFLEPNVLTNW